MNETAAKIVSEVTEMREESVKYFLCDDGSYIAATYAAPVHYNENGVWKEIDNTLTPSSKSGETVYSTKGGLNITVPSELGSGKRFTATNGGYTISFGVKSIDNSLSAQAKVVETDALPSVVKMNSTAEISDEKVTALSMAQNAETLTEKQKVEKFNNEQMTVDKQSGAVVYKGFDQQSDLEYIVTSNSLKENIVVYKPQDEYVYSFDLDSDGLIPVEQANGSIILVESEASQEAVFTLDAPYMYDANGAESYDIELSIKENGDEYVVTVEVDSTWLNNSEREFPVVIDPTWSAPNSKIQDIYVINGTFANSPRSNSEIRAGRNLTNIVRSYIKLTLPSNLPIGYSLYNSTLVLRKQNYFKVSEDIEVRAYDCKDAAAWSTSSISWNNQPFNNSNNGYLNSNPELLSSVAASSGLSSYTFNITGAVQRWINGGNNNGIMLASSNESTKTQVDFYSTRASSSGSRPSFVMYYYDPYVSEKKWTPKCQLSDSKTVHVRCSLPWTVEISPDSPWLSVTDLKDKTFKLRAAENTMASARSGTATVKTSLNGVESVIGTIAVTQFGAEPNIILSTEQVDLKHTNQSKTITVTSNSSWTVSKDSDWIDIENGEGTGNASFEINTTENNTSNTRIGTITVQAGTVSKTITVTQFDGVSELFNPINSNDTSETRASTEYNHPLAQWAMKLAYSAYMPLKGRISDIAPGMFMESGINPAQDELAACGFESNIYNNGENDTVCHVIGHRNISYDLSNNIDGGNDDATLGVYKNVSGSGFEGCFISNDQSGLRSDDAMDSTGMYCGGYSGAFWNTLSLEGANNTDGGNNNGTLGILEGTGKCEPTGVFSGNDSSGLRTDVSMDSIGMSCVGSSEAFWNTLSLEGANNTDCVFKTNTNGGNNGYFGVSKGTIARKSVGAFVRNDSSCLRTDDFVDDIYIDSRQNSGTFQNTLNSDGENNADCMRTLVVVDIRGTSTNKDWITDVGTQFTSVGINFETGMNMVLNSLYHGTGDTENCTECNGDGCEFCEGYIPHNNISNPIFLVTGHSLGAAVANLVASHLNSCTDTAHCSGTRTVQDVYAYTFATPKTVKNSTGNNDQNIFNILNNNDVVPLVPTNIMALNWADNGWTRHGRDFHLSMPMYVQLPLLKSLDTAALGLGGHAMSTYSHWLETLPGKLNKNAEAITAADLDAISDAREAAGLLPRLLRVKCPVDVTLKDSEGNIIAYESARENAVYPNITESEVVSWISNNNEKVFFLPFGCEDVTAEIEAYDYGTMNVALETIGAGDQLDSMTYSNVSLYPGKDFEIQIDENSVPSESQLMAVAEDGTQTEPSKNPYLKSAVPDTPYAGNNYITVVTDRSVTKVQFVHHDSRDTMTYTRDNVDVTLVDDGEVLTWRIHRNFPATVYDVGVKVGSYNWYYTERVFELKTS